MRIARAGNVLKIGRKGIGSFGIVKEDAELTGEGCPFYLLWKSADLWVAREEAVLYRCW